PKRRGISMHRHERVVALFINLTDAVGRVDQLTPDETRRLLLEATEVMSLLLERDAEISLREERSFRAKHLRARRDLHPG
ncbi:hypothetical protein AB4144_24690, partial [Rhizobiaceae sp. 2RAB30]